MLSCFLLFIYFDCEIFVTSIGAQLQGSICLPASHYRGCHWDLPPPIQKFLTPLVVIVKVYNVLATEVSYGAWRLLDIFSIDNRHLRLIFLGLLCAALSGRRGPPRRRRRRKKLSSWRRRSRWRLGRRRFGDGGST